tara:strand:+ start:4500 stop:4982 length:483 start_codon:yes stop_codon:yes gene_type:complete
MIEMKKHVEPGKTPAQITVSMIDQDLKDGISKSEMAVKYGIKPWEVDEMFKHPFLKGRRPSRKKALSFTFVDDITAEVDESFVDPNQVTLEDAIDEAIESVEEAKEELQKTEEAIVDMLSPTETVGNTEYHEDLVNEIKALQSENEDEDEIEMDDGTFEL